jgi:hypothetical protein
MKAIKSATETTLYLLAAMLLVTTIVALAVAQDPDSEEQHRRICAGSDRPERKACGGWPSENSSVLNLEDASGESMKSGDFSSERAQISNDLNYLKSAADYLARASQSQDLDFKSIASATAQVRKRAERLRSILPLPGSGTSSVIRELELPTDGPQLRLYIYSFSTQIADAVRNPLLKGHLLDVTGSARARADLDALIELAKWIRMQCELLSRTAAERQ